MCVNNYLEDFCFFIEWTTNVLFSGQFSLSTSGCLSTRGRFILIATKSDADQSVGFLKLYGPLYMMRAVVPSSSMSVRFGSNFGVMRKYCPECFVSAFFPGALVELATILLNTNRSFLSSRP